MSIIGLVSYVFQVRKFIHGIRRALLLQFKTPVVFKNKRIYQLRDSNNKVLFRLAILRSNFAVTDRFIRQSYNTYVRNTFMGVSIVQIKNASCTQLFSWLEELQENPRTKRFISKNYKKSFTDIFIIKLFLTKYLYNLQFLYSTPIGPTILPTQASTPIKPKSSNPYGRDDDSITPSMSITFGGIMWNAYSACGGSRLYLSTTSFPDINGNTIVNYMNIDCTKNVIISTDVNICTFKAGCVFTFYLVPMLTAANDPTNIRYNGSSNSPINPALLTGLEESNGDYDAEYGIGYRDAQSTSSASNTATNTASPCIEIDLFELTLCNVQTTTHGYMWEDNIDRFGSYQNAWGTVGYYDKYDENATYVQKSSFDKNSSAPPFGPGDMFTINTLDTFNISSSITIEGTILTVVTTITQQRTDGNVNTLTLAPKPSVFTGADGKLVSELSTMQLVSAIWVTTPINGSNTPITTTWLDGIDVVESTDIVKSYAQNQKAPPIDGDSSTNNLTAVTVEDSNSISYDYSYKMGADTTTNSENYGPIFARYQNVQIQQKNLSSGLTPCWSLDYKFRGMGTDNTTLKNWHGFYGQTYGVAYAPIGSDILICNYNDYLLTPEKYYNTVSDGLHYGDSGDLNNPATNPTNTPTPDENYFAELTGLGVTDEKQSININTNYGYGYALEDATVEDLERMNSYQINYIATPDLITFTTLCS